jgi:hypothetical protein
MKFLPLYKGKLGETQGRKAKGAKASKRSYASQKDYVMKKMFHSP